MTILEKVYVTGSVALGVGMFVWSKAIGYADSVGIIAGFVVFVIPVFMIGVARGTRVLAGIIGLITALLRVLFGFGWNKSK